MVRKVKNINPYLRVTSTDREIEYYSNRNDARISFHPRDKYKMIEVIKLILDKASWRNRAPSLHTDTMRHGSVYRLLAKNGLGHVEYFGNNWYKQDLEDVLADLKLSSVLKDILKEKNIDKLKEILKGMSLDELIYLHESEVVNE